MGGLESAYSTFMQKEGVILQELVGKLLLNDNVPLSLLWFSSKDIFHPQYQKLLRAIEKTYDEGFGRDTVRIGQKAAEDGLEFSFITALFNTTYHSTWIEANIEEYKAFLRNKKVIKLGNDLMIKGSSSINNGDIISYANTLLETIESSTKDYSIEENVEGLQSYLENRKGKELFGYSFGDEFSFLDKATRGVQQWRTYRIGALSNFGKTQLIYWVINNLISQWAKVAFFSLENDRDMTLSNLVANRQRVNSWDLESGKAEVDYDLLWEMNEKLFVIDDTYELSEIFSKILTIKPDVVILDYIGLVTINRFWESDMFTEYSKRVQQFVKKVRVSWVDLSNLPMWVEDAQIISRWQFFWSSYLRNNADVGLHLVKYDEFYAHKQLMEEDSVHRNKMQNDIQYRMDWTSKKGIKIAITKNRIGPAWINEDFIVNFALWWRFTAATAAQKDIFSR